MTRRDLSCALCLAFAVLILAPVLAQGTTVMGKITSVDTAAGTMTVDTPSGSVVYRTNAQTMYMAGERTVRIDDLKTGDRVTLTVSGQGTEQVASHVSVMKGATTTTGKVVTNLAIVGSKGSARQTAACGEQLPKTASALPIVGLGALLLVGCALSLRASRLYSR